MSYWDDDDPPIDPDEPYFRVAEPILEEPYWFGNEVVIEDGYGDLRSYTKEEWHETLLADGDTIEYFFGMGHLDVIYELIYAGAWDDNDWEEWRDAYASVHGV